MSIRAIAFDFYGTLVDIESMRATVMKHSAAALPFIDVWRAKQLQYAFLTTLMDRYADFDALTEAAMEFAASQFKVRLNSNARKELLAAWTQLKPFSDVGKTLGALKESKIRLAILSNGTPATLKAAVKSADLMEAFEAILSIDAAGAYKPRPEAYQLAVDHFKLEAAEIGFVSAHGWDVVGAAEFGLRAFWCNRRHAPAERIGADPVATLMSFDELGEAVKSVE